LIGGRLCAQDELMTTLTSFSEHVGNVTNLSAVLPTSLIQKMTEQVNQAHKVIERYLIPEIRQRREEMATGAKGGDDFLGGLLRQSELDGEPLSEVRLCRLIGIMVFAAYHTTTHALTHLLYDLAARPDIRERIHAEQRAARARSGSGALSEEVISSHMPLLDAAIRESQRLSTGALNPVRKVTSDIRCPDGTVIPKGAILALSPWLVHHDTDLYPEPLEFKLERFAGKPTPPARQFLAFGGGKHQCPGRFFAMLEIKCLVSAIFSKYDVAGDTLAPYDFSNGLCERKRMTLTLSALKA